MKEPNVKLGIKAALLVGGAVLAAGSASVANAGTPDWPNRPVTMVVPTAAGGTLDLVGRILGPRLSELLGKPVVIENVGGTGGVIGASRIAKSVPDGHQILLGTGGTQAQSQSIYRRPPYDALADFSAVTLLVKMPVVLTARKDLPVTNLHEFTAYAKANQGTMQYGITGRGFRATPRLCATQCRDRYQRYAPALSRRRAGAAGSDRRSNRLPVHARWYRDPANRGEAHQSDCGPLGGALGRTGQRSFGPRTGVG